MRTTRQSRRSLLLLSLFAALALFVSACGDDTDTVEAGSGGDNASGDDSTDDTPGIDDGSGSQPGDTGSGDVTGMCAADAPDCVDTPDVSTDPGGTLSPAQATPIEPNPAGATNPQPSAWDGYDVSDDGTTLTVGFYMGVDSCYSLDHVQVDETDATVTVTIFTGGNPDLDPDTACIEIAEYRSVTVTLDAPLGDRTVVDGSI